VHLTDGGAAPVLGRSIRQLEDQLGAPAPPKLQTVAVCELSLLDLVAIDEGAIARAAVTQGVAVTDGDDFGVITRDLSARQVEIARDPPPDLKRVLRDLNDSPT
jgi:hypothetical protein